MNNDMTTGGDTALLQDNETLRQETKKAAEAAAKLASSLEETARIAARSAQQAENIENAGTVIVHASRELARNLSERLRTTAANAAGDYREGQRGSWNTQYRELTEKIMEQNPHLSEQAARGYARSQMAAEAKYKIDSQNPRKKKKMAKAEDWALKRMAAGGEGLLDGVQKIRPGAARPWEMDRFRTPGLGLTPRVSPAQARSANASASAEKNAPTSNIAGTSQSILEEIRQINQTLTTITII